MPVSNLYNLYDILFRPCSNFTTAQDIEVSSRQLEKDKNTKLRLLGLEPRESECSESSDGEMLANLKGYIATFTGNESLGKLLFGSGFALSADHVQTQASLNTTIEAHFHRLNSQHNYFSRDKHSDAYTKELNAYRACYLTTHYARKVLRDGQVIEIEIAAGAYNMTVMCYSDDSRKGNELDTLNKATEVLKNFSQGSRQPLHDVFTLTNIPQEFNATKFDIGAWRLLLTKDSNLIVLKTFARAVEIHPYLIPPLKSAADIAEALPKLTYPEFAKNPDLARLYGEYGVEAAVFDRSLELMRNGTIYTKTADNIPSVVVDFSTIDETFTRKGYYLVKLPANDWRALILGKITNCCQSIGGFGEACVINGITLEHNGFYVFIKANNNKPFDPNTIDWRLSAFEAEGHKIIGQAYVWRSSSGNMTYDSIEMLKDHEDLPILKALKRMAELVAAQDPYLERVTVGLGGRTKEIKDFKAVTATKSIEQVYIGEIYDANDQFEIWHLEEGSPRVARRRQLLKQLLDQNNIDAATKDEIETRSTQSKFKQLTSYGAIFCYKQGYCSFDELKVWSAERIVILTSTGAQSAYKAGARLADLKNFDSETMSIFLSLGAQATYRAGATFTDLRHLFEQDINRVYQLISDETRELYCLGITFADLKALSVEKIQQLTSSPVQMAYKAGYCSFSDLKDLSPELTTLLTSQEACALYQQKYCAFSDLKHLELQKIKRLISQAQELYRLGITFADIKDLSVEKIEQLISWPVQMAYNLGYCSFADLKDLSPELITLLTSPETCVVYRKKYCAFSDLKNLELQKIKRLTSGQTLELFKKGVNISDLQSLSEEMIAGLSSENALAAYRAGATLDDIKALLQQPEEPNQLHRLLCPQAQEAYTLGAKFSDLKAISLERLNELLPVLQTVLKNYHYLQPRPAYTFADLKELSVEKIQQLTSPMVQMAYQAGYCSFADLKDLSPGLITLLTSEEAYAVYQRKYCSLKDLQDLSPELITVLTSREICAVYQQKYCTLKDLQDLSPELITRLTSREACAVYQQKYCTLKDLQNLSPELITLLTSQEACVIYQQKYCAFSDLKDLEPQKIKRLTSRQAQVLFAMGVNFSDILNLSEEMIAGLSSENALAAYRAGATLDGIKALLQQPEEPNQLHRLFSPQAQGAYTLGAKFSDLKAISIERLNELLPVLQTVLRYHYYSRQPQAYTFADLMNLPVERIKLLTSSSAQYAYQWGVSFADLADLDSPAIEALISPQALRAYELRATFQDLKTLSPEKIEVLTSDEAKVAYGEKYCTFQDLKQLNLETIRILISREAYDAYRLGAKIDDLTDVPLGRIKELTSNPARQMLQLGASFADLKFMSMEKLNELLPVLQGFHGCSQYRQQLAPQQKEQLAVIFSNLKDLSVEKIQALISFDAQMVYTYGVTTCSELKDLSVQKINELLPILPRILRQAYGEKQHYTLSDFKALHLEEIIALTSREAITVYQKGYCSFSDLKALHFEEINALTSSEAITVYEKGYCSFSDLKDFDVKTIQVLTSYQAQAAYRFGIAFSDFVGITADRIKELITPQALEVYTLGATLSELKDLDAENIRTLTSYEAIKVYNMGAKIADLLGVDLEDMKKLRSWQAEEAYRAGIKISDLKILDMEQIEAFTPWLWDILETYGQEHYTLSDLKDLEVETIQLLTSSRVQKFYKVGMTFDTVKTLFLTHGADGFYHALDAFHAEASSKQQTTSSLRQEGFFSAGSKLSDENTQLKKEEQADKTNPGLCLSLPPSYFHVQ